MVVSQVVQQTRAILHGMAYAARRHAGFVAFSALFISLFTVGLLEPSGAPPAIAVRSDVVQNDVAASYRASRLSMCEWGDRCRDYGAAVQSCAAAGNYALCMKLRFGMIGFAEFWCTDHGQPTVSWRDEVPGALECIWRRQLQRVGAQ